MSFTSSSDPSSSFLLSRRIRTHIFVSVKLFAFFLYPLLLLSLHSEGCFLCFKKNHILVSSKVSVLLFLACVTTATKQMEKHYQRRCHPRCCLYLFTPPNVSHRFISLLCSRSIIECIRRAFAHCCCGLTFHQSLFCYGYVASVPVDSVESGLCKRFSKSFLCTSRHVL